MALLFSHIVVLMFSQLVSAVHQNKSSALLQELSATTETSRHLSALQMSLQQRKATIQEANYLS